MYVGFNLLQRKLFIDLMNIKIIFLSANVISLCQPFDQDIIRTFKTYYRRKWIRYICDQYEKKLNSMKFINVLQAIRWTIKAWKENVNIRTIQNCWIKSKILNVKYESIIKEKAKNVNWKKNETQIEYDQIVDQVEDQIRDLIKQRKIVNVMIIDQFLNSVSEIVEDRDDDDLINVIFKIYSKEKKIYESNEKKCCNKKNINKWNYSDFETSTAIWETARWERLQFHRMFKKACKADEYTHDAQANFDYQLFYIEFEVFISKFMYL